MRHIFAAALAFFLALPLFADYLTVSPPYLNLLLGESEEIYPCLHPLSPFVPFAETAALINDAPDVVRLELNEAPYGKCGGYKATGLTAGRAFLRWAVTGEAIAMVDVVDCPDFSRLGAARRVIDAVPGTKVLLSVPVETSNSNLHFTWYVGALGNRSQPQAEWRGSLFEFTPPEAKEYPVWVEVSESCATRSVEFVIDATAKRRRSVTRR